ncbi:zinc finger, C2H5-type domain containing protein [Rhodotorula toruloides]|uniref:Zinc finger, C2H5-type domain containing protein n=1 Tax=Rhodotorula toruloides TaxID=5286 RepID=A0A511KKL7_RHOTO|nr:zinc finger, C2H5-type domain containing protein [Rhodotorula toruloides]
MLSLSTDVPRDFESLVTPTTFVSSHSLPHTVPLDDYAFQDSHAMHSDLFAHDSPSPDLLASTLSWHAASEGSDLGSHSSSPATSFRSTTPAPSPLEDKAYVVRGPAEVEDDPFEAFGFGESLRPPFGTVSNSPKLSSQHLDALVPESLQRPPSLANDALNPATTTTTTTTESMFRAHVSAGCAGQQTMVFAAHDLSSSSTARLFVDSLDYGAQAFAASGGIVGAQQHAHGQPYSFVQSAPPSSLDFPSQQPAVPPTPQHAFYSAQPTAYPQQQSFQFVANPSQQQAQPYVPVQFTTLNGATYAVAVPVSSQTPQAIETPHGTYYFVPSSLPIQQPALQAQAQAQAQAPIQSVSPPPAPSPPAAASPPPTEPTPQQGLTTRSMSGGRPKRAPLTSSSIVVPSGTHAAVQAATNAALAVANVATLSTQQKIRLPVGQGKKGSTKRHPPKKEQPKRFVCPHPGCGRPFSRNFNMRTHYQSHLGIREFECPACPKKFSRRHDRARHCAAVHELCVDREGDALSREQSEEARDAEEEDDYAVRASG